MRIRRVLFVLCCLVTAANALELPEVVDVGDVKSRESATKTVTAVNRGTTPVQVERVRTSCGCTAVSFPRDPIAPGAAARFTLKYAAGSAPGPQSKTVYIYLRGRDEVLTVTLKANVVPNPAVAAATAPPRAPAAAPEAVVSAGEPPSAPKEDLPPAAVAAQEDLTPKAREVLAPVPDEGIPAKASLAVPRQYKDLLSGESRGWLANPVWLWIAAIFAPNALLLGVIFLRRKA